MTIELSQHEINIIEQALDVWEKDASTGALMGTMLGAMLSPRDERDKWKDDSKREMEKATDEGNRRKRVSTLLRAKLYQADAKQAEHTIA